MGAVALSAILPEDPFKSSQAPVLFVHDDPERSGCKIGGTPVYGFAVIRVLPKLCWYICAVVLTDNIKAKKNRIAFFLLVKALLFNSIFFFCLGRF